MKIRILIVAVFAILDLACSQKSNNKSIEVENKNLTHIAVVDEVEPPPPNFISKFNTIQEWLYNVCADTIPVKSITTYEIGLFKSSDKATIYLVGLNKNTQHDTSFTNIAFEPSNMYYHLPKSFYENRSREKLINTLALELKNFTLTEKFKNSFLAKADSIVLAVNGQKIWSKM